jgi:NADH:ubiquinone oxidoreductase subunit F (NADH-binding)
VSNAETVAHLALLARLGPSWFREAGGPVQPGSTLVTLAGQVAVPGLVAEVVDPLPLGRLLATVGGLDAPPRAVLVGGYEGAWVPGEVAWATPVDRGLLSAAGAPLGCGILAVLGPDGCGLATTARLLGWLAGESAGQCGPCAHGLPALARAFAELAGPFASRRDERRARQLIAAVHGRGACGHPTGAAVLAESALDAFPDEIRRHRHHRGCPPVTDGLPLPGSGPGDGG